MGIRFGEARAGKLLTFLDRLILHAPRSTRGGKNHKGLNEVVSSRLRLAWQGDWGALWRDAAAADKKGSFAANRAPTPGEDARAINRLVGEGLLSKALSRLNVQSSHRCWASYCQRPPTVVSP